MSVLGTALLAGLALTGRGLYLLFCTNLANRGMGGILTIVGYLTAGIFLLVPAKVYIIVKLTRRGA